MLLSICSLILIYFCLAGFWAESFVGCLWSCPGSYHPSNDDDSGNRGSINLTHLDLRLLMFFQPFFINSGGVGLLKRYSELGRQKLVANTIFCQKRSHHVIFMTRNVKQIAFFYDFRCHFFVFES